MQINDLENKALWLRQELWKMVMRKGKGHIPSAFSCVEKRSLQLAQERRRLITCPSFIKRESITLVSDC